MLSVITGLSNRSLCLCMSCQAILLSVTPSMAKALPLAVLVLPSHLNLVAYICGNVLCPITINYIHVSVMTLQEPAQSSCGCQVRNVTIHYIGEGL